MKIKIALAKYLDWVVLAALFIFLLFAVYKSFIAADTSIKELSEELRRFDRTVRDGMRKDTAPPIPERDYVAELRNRFEHMPVLNPYRRNPFVTLEDVVYPVLLQLALEQSKEIKLKGTRLVDVINPDPRVGVKLDYDPETRESTVEFKALQEGEANIRIRDDIEQVYRFRINVRRTPKLDPPRPPIEVVFATRPPIERRGRREPPMVLISFLPDNPSSPIKGVGYTTNANVYRKPADAADVEYVLLNKTPLLPASRDQIQILWKRFQIEEESETPTAARPAVTAPQAGPVVPQEAGDITRRRTFEQETATLGKPAPGSFVLLDESVDEGENYIYKLVTISSGPDAEPAACEHPYISADPISVPSLVQFTVLSVLPGRARLRLFRKDPDTEQTIAREFSVIPGMAIGGKVKVRVEGVDTRTGARYKDKEIDFSTNCILVDTLGSYRDVEYRLPLRVDSKTSKPRYQPRLVSSPQILYLTPRGSMRVKGKEEEKRQPSMTTAPTERMPGTPAGPLAP